MQERVCWLRRPTNENLALSVNLYFTKIDPPSEIFVKGAGVASNLVQARPILVGWGVGETLGFPTSFTRVPSSPDRAHETGRPEGRRPQPGGGAECHAGPARGSPKRSAAEGRGSGAGPQGPPRGGRRGGVPPATLCSSLFFYP